MPGSRPRSSPEEEGDEPVDVAHAAAVELLGASAEAELHRDAGGATRFMNTPQQ
jgi:hypothetical protein